MGKAAVAFTQQVVASTRAFICIIIFVTLRKWFCIGVKKAHQNMSINRSSRYGLHSVVCLTSQRQKFFCDRQTERNYFFSNKDYLCLRNRLFVILYYINFSSKLSTWTPSPSIICFQYDFSIYLTIILTLLKLILILNNSRLNGGLHIFLI